MFNDLIGRRDLIDFNGAEEHWKAHGLDLRKLIVFGKEKDETFIIKRTKS